MDEASHLIIDLYEALEQQPSSVLLHERLVEVWNEAGDKDMAKGVASALLTFDPRNKTASNYLRQNQSDTAVQISSATSSKPKEESMPLDEITLGEGYTSLKLQAKLLHTELEGVLRLGDILLDDDEVITNLKAISDGRVSMAVPLARPIPVRETARAVMKTPNDCGNLIMEDFEAFIRWATYQTPPLDTNVTREKLMKRKTLLEAAIPESMKRFSISALVQIERDYLQKKYANTETMLGDRIENIPQTRFFVSEDNYAWDIEELAQAITSNEGVMRNPLSRAMFSKSDIKLILSHPLGTRLRPLHMTQNQLKKGVRPATIERVRTLGYNMLEFQGVNTTPIQEAIDEFEAYVATIPNSEQKTIHSLKIPAKDGTTGQQFDYTIGESVRDAKANITCFHKVGHFLSQAAAYLRRQ